MLNFIGKTPVHPFLFISGKLAIFLTWTGFFSQFFYDIRFIRLPLIANQLAIAIFFIGLGIALISILNLGFSTRFGIPKEKTVFKTRGLYSYSRNPMYIGFGLMTIASVVFAFNPVIAVLASYGGIIHHKIILAEEAFLRQAFGKQYEKYCKKVRRYL